MTVWKQIKGYEELYEINEKGMIRRKDGMGNDGRKVTEHLIATSKAQNGMRYVSLRKNGKRRSHMQHKVYASAFGITENEAVRRLYYGFYGDQDAIEKVRTLLKGMIFELEEEERNGTDRHDELLYMESFLEELETDGVRGIS